MGFVTTGTDSISPKFVYFMLDVVQYTSGYPEDRCSLSDQSQEIF